MSPKLKADWIEALRSRKYPQATGTLQDHNGNYCCLGVLADISNLGKWDRHLQYVIYDGGGSEIICVGDLGKALCIFGLSLDEEKVLVNMNDEKKDTFASIADYIERAVK